MKKNGFTLIEIIGVLVIIGLLLILILPNVLNNFYNNKEKYTELNDALIIEAARVYVSNNFDKFPKSFGNEACISLGDLVSSGYLEEENVKDIKNYDNYSIEAYYNGDYYELDLKSNGCK